MILFSGWSCSRERERVVPADLSSADLFTVVVIIIVQRQQGDPTGPRDPLPKRGEGRKEKNSAREVGCPSSVWGQVWRSFQWWILKCCKIGEGDSWGHPGPCLMLGGALSPPISHPLPPLSSLLHWLRVAHFPNKAPNRWFFLQFCKCLVSSSASLWTFFWRGGGEGVVIYMYICLFLYFFHSKIAAQTSLGAPIPQTCFTRMEGGGKCPMQRANLLSKLY